MPKKRMSQKLILTACRLSFNGSLDSEIASELSVNPATVSAWRNTELWQEFEAELVDAYKQYVIEAEFATPVGD